MTLSIVIPTFNRSASLKKTLDSLAKQTDMDFDVLVVDGESRDATHSVVKSFQKRLNIRKIVDKTPHLSYIRDRAWQETKGEIVASIDDDVVVSPEWTGAIKKTFENNTSIGGVTGPTVIPEKLLKKRDFLRFHTTKNPMLKALGLIYFKAFTNGEKYAVGTVYPSGAWSPGSNFKQSRNLKKPQHVDFLQACNFAVPRSIMQEVGGFDTGYRGTSEYCEMDLSFRIRKAGYILIFDPHVSVEHHVSKSGSFARRTFAFERLSNFIRFYKNAYYPKTINGGVRFFLYCMFLCAYIFYSGIGKKT